jgi:hypothetical protein
MITFLLAAYFSIYLSGLYVIASILFAMKSIDSETHDVIRYPLMLILFSIGALITILYAPVFVYRALFFKNYIHFVALSIYLTTMEER